MRIIIVHLLWSVDFANLGLLLFCLLFSSLAVAQTAVSLATDEFQPQKEHNANILMSAWRSGE